MARILVVDDEPDIVRVVVAIMKDCGHEVTVARDGESALESATRSPPDLVILDLMLPGMDGYEVCQKLKEGSGTGHIPVIMMTASHVSLADAKRCSGVGANEYVVKPFMREVLVRNVERWLPRGGAR